ncbi:MAG TPA: hypothetical protein VFQ42_21885 [Mycobacterium sp.]|nr:hypothetical protein [Mycobacterium sp.]
MTPLAQRAHADKHTGLVSWHVRRGALWLTRLGGGKILPTWGDYADAVAVLWTPEEMPARCEELKATAIRCRP